MNCLKVVRNNFKRSCNRPISFAINLVIPIIVVVLGIFANSISKPSFTIGIINETPYNSMIETLSNTNGVTVVKANQDMVKIDLMTGKYDAVLDFSQSDYTLYSIKSDQVNDQIEQIIATCQSSDIPIDIETVVNTSMSLAARSISFLLVFLMVTATVTASFMIKDKKNGTLIRYQYSPQNPINYIWGNNIYNYLITYFQYLICVTGIKVIGVEIEISYLNLVLMGIWLSGIATAFGTFISSIFREEMYANLSASFSTLILALVGGTFIAYENMPNMLQKISIISPLRWFIDITRSMENGLNWFDNITQIGILSAIIIFFYLLMFTFQVLNKNK